MSKREGNALGGLSELAGAFEGQTLPQEHVPEEIEPVVETDDTAGDAVDFEDRRYIFNGYTEDGKARLVDIYTENGQSVTKEVFVTKTQLLEGFRHAQQDEAKEESKVEEEKHHAQVAAETRVVKDVASGTPEPIAIDHEIAHDVASVEAVLTAADGVPLPGEGERAPMVPGQVTTSGAPEGVLAADDRAERAKELQKEAERALELEGQIAALRKKKGKKHEVGELYIERDKLDEHIHGVLREIAPEVLGSILSDDIARIDKMRALFGDEKDLVARRQKEQELIASGKIAPADLAAYKNALGKRNSFIRSVTALGVPHHVATRLYRNEGEAVQELDQITRQAEAGDTKVLKTPKAKHLFSRYGFKAEGVQHFIEEVESNQAKGHTSEFEAFAVRGNNKPVQPTVHAEAAPIATADLESTPVALVESFQDIAPGDINQPLIEDAIEGSKRTRKEQLAQEEELITSLKDNIEKLGFGADRVRFEAALAKFVDKHNDRLKESSFAAFTEDLHALGDLQHELAQKVSIAPISIKRISRFPVEAEAMHHEIPVTETGLRTRESAGLVETKEKHPLSLEVIEKFGNEGVDASELLAIPGFVTLTEGQQLLMLKNYSTALVGKVKREAKKEADEAWGKRSFLGKVGLSMITMGLAKNVAEQTKQRDIARKLSSGDHLVAAERKAMLEAFAKVAEEGPEVIKEADGSLRMNYLGSERFKGNAEALAIVEAYNAAAAKFAKIPKQWLDADIAVSKSEQPGYFAKLLGHKNLALSGKEHLQVAETREAYQEAREQLLTAIEKYEGKEGDPESRRKAMLELNGLDERVQLNQLFSSNPDAEQALQDIRDTNVFTRSLSEFAKNRGQYMAYGSATRIAAVAALGAIALPATAAIAGGAVAVGVAGAVGYFQARREAKELLKTRRASGMIGDAELQEDVVYAANNEEILERKEEARDEALRAGDNARAESLKSEIKDLREKIKAGNIIEHRTKKLREFRDAKFYTDRVERLLTKLDVANEMGDKESAEILERKIAQTATLMRELMKQGMLSFGQESRLARINARAEGKHPVVRADDARSALNGLAFMQALGHADAVHALDMSAIEGKLDTILEGYREDIDASARKRSNKHISKAVALRVGFGLAGYGLTHAAANFFGHTDTSVAHGAIAHGARPSVLAPGEHAGRITEHAELALGAHTVASGETLTSIVRKFPEIAKLPAHEQETAVANLVKHLSPERLKLMGISSGNADLIRTGEHIDLSKLHGALHEVKGGGEVVAAHTARVIAHPEHVQAAPVHEAVTHAPKASESIHGAPRESHLPSAPTHEVIRKSILPGSEHAPVAPPAAHAAEMAAVAQNKMSKTIESIFGKKGVFGRDHYKEWEGDPVRHTHGLKDASAESLLSKRVGLLSESRTRMHLREYMRSLDERSGVHPRTGETAEMYIKRALIEEERAQTHRAMGAELVRRGEQAINEGEALRSRPLDESIKSVTEERARRAAEVAEIKNAYRASAPEVVTAHMETVHSTDEALEKLMPALLRKFPELAKDDEGVRINVLNNFLHDAKPGHFKALGLDGEDMQKYVGGGKVDAAKIASYFKSHHATAGHSAAPVTHEVQTPAHAAPVHVESMATADVSTLEKGWDALSLDQKSAAAEQMIPKYLEQQITAHVQHIDIAHFMGYLHRLPSNAIYAPREAQLESMPAEYADALDAIKGIVLSKKLMNENGMPNDNTTLFDYLFKAYKGRMMFDGPTSVK